MTILRLTFAGQIKKAEHKTINGKALAEVSICKKQKGRNGADDTFCWVKASIWEPAEFQIAKLVKGAFIAGSGEFSSRSYDGKDGKATSLECRCSSFDVEVSGDAAPQPAAQPARSGSVSNAASIGGGYDDAEQPPFAPIGREYQA